MNTIVIFRVEDWEVMYVNLELVAQGHSVDIRDLVPYTPISAIKLIPAYNSALERYACDTGSWPSTFLEASTLSQTP